MTGTDIRVSLQTVAALDGEIMRLKKAQRDSLGALSNLRYTFTAYEVERHSTTAHLKELKKHLYEKEHELTETTLALKTKSALLDRCTNAKQYEVLMREITELLEKKPLLEAAVFDLMTRADEEEAGRADVMRMLDAKEEELKKNITEAEKNNVALATTLQEQLKNRDKVLLELPVAWQDLYKKLATTIENPLVRVLNTTCSGCFYSVSPNELAHIHKEYIGRCRDCYRILFEFAPELEVLVEKVVHP